MANIHEAVVVDGWPQHPSQEQEQPPQDLARDISKQLHRCFKEQARGTFGTKLRIMPHPDNLSIWYCAFTDLESPALEGATVLASLSFYTRHRSCQKWHRHFPDHGPQFAVLTPTGIFSPRQGTMNVCMPGLTVGSQNEWRAAWDGAPSKGSQVKVLRRDGNGSVIHKKSSSGKKGKAAPPRTSAKYDLQESMVNWFKVMLGVFDVGVDICFERPEGGAVRSGGWLSPEAASFDLQRQCAEQSLAWNWQHYPKLCELLSLPPPAEQHAGAAAGGAAAAAAAAAGGGGAKVKREGVKSEEGGGGGGGGKKAARQGGGQGGGIGRGKSGAAQVAATPPKREAPAVVGRSKARGAAAPRKRKVKVERQVEPASSNYKAGEAGGGSPSVSSTSSGSSSSSRSQPPCSVLAACTRKTSKRQRR